MTRHAAPNPGLRRFVAERDRPAQREFPDDRLEGDAGFQHLAAVGEQGAELLVADCEPVLGVEQHETFREARHRVDEGAALGLGGPRQALALDLAVAEQRQHADHRADLVAPRRRQRRVEPPAGVGFERMQKPIQGRKNRAQDQHGQRGAGDDGDERHDQRDPRGCRRAGQHPRAGRVGSRGHGVVERREPLVDGEAVLARLGEQRIADHPPVVDIGLHRFARGGIEQFGFIVDFGGGVGLCGGERVELGGEPLAGQVRIALRERQQAHRQIRHPIAQICEGRAHVVGLADQGDEPVRLPLGLGRAI